MKIFRSFKLKKIMLALVIGISILGVGKYLSKNINASYAATSYKYWTYGTPWVHRHSVKGKSNVNKTISKKIANSFAMRRGTKLGSVQNYLTVFCAYRSKGVESSRRNHEFGRKTTNEFFSSAGEDRINKLNKLLLLHSPNGETDVTEVKNYLQTNYPTEYEKYGWSKLDRDDIYSAMACAVWILINYDKYFYSTSSNYGKRLNNLIYLFSQGYFDQSGRSVANIGADWPADPGALKNINVGSSGSSITWTKGKDIESKNGTIQFVLSASTTPNSAPTISIKTDTDVEIATSDITTSLSGKSLTVTLKNNFTYSVEEGLKYKSQKVKGLNISISSGTSVVRTPFVYYRLGVNTNYLKGDYQYFVGTEEDSSIVTQNVSLVTEGTPQLYKVVFDKLSIDDANSGSIGNAHLVLERVYTESGTMKSSIVEEWNTVQDETHIVDNLSSGYYRILESVTPSGYTYYDSSFSDKVGLEAGYRGYKLTNTDNIFYVGPENDPTTGKYTSSAVDNTHVYYAHLYNKPTVVTIRKEDKATQNRIGNASFVIVDSSGQDIISFTTSETADANFDISKYFSDGYYFLIETAAPLGHVPYTDSAFMFKVGNPVDADGNPIEDPSVEGHICPGDLEDGGKCEYYDLKIVKTGDATTGYTYTTASDGSVELKLPNITGNTFSKVDIDDDSINVVGANMKIINTVGSGTNVSCATGSDEIVYESWVSGNVPYATTKYYTDGNYCLVESVPAPGYASAESKIFTIQDGKVTNYDDSVMKDAPLDICVYKTATNISGYLGGATFQLVDSSGKVIETFTSSSDGPYCFNTSHKLEVGKTYTLKETEAPSGYRAAANTTFKVEDTTEEQIIEIENEVEVPKTAMSPSSLIYIAVLLMGIAGIGMVCYYVKKYNY